MTDARDEITRLRLGLHAAIAYLQHCKDDAECKLVSYPDTIQRGIDDLQGVLNGGNACDVFRAAAIVRGADFQGEVPALKSAVQP